MTATASATDRSDRSRLLVKSLKLARSPANRIVKSVAASLRAVWMVFTYTAAAMPAAAHAMSAIETALMAVHRRPQTNMSLSWMCRAANVQRFPNAVPAKTKPETPNYNSNSYNTLLRNANSKGTTYGQLHGTATHATSWT